MNILNKVQAACSHGVQRLNQLMDAGTETLEKTSKGLLKFSTIVLTSTVVAISISSCDKNLDQNNFDQSTSAGSLATLSCADTVSIPVDANGIITATTLTKDKLWKLNGVSYVKDGQVLSIEAGTTIITGRTKTYNDPTYGIQNLAGVLVVARGGQLIANGTATQPIVFTSPSAGGCGSGCSSAGAFGGVVLLGKATTNRNVAVRIEGIPQPAGTDITYGGPGNTIANDNSGSLKYVRIEFPGYKLAADNEINGLTLGGVGSGTTLSHIQVSYSADDAFEFFGGTVNADHLVAIGTDDDDFDFDFGYSGTIQYAIGLKDPGTTNSTSGGNSDSNGIESDNDGTGTSALPKTKPVLRNFTLLGYGSNSIGSGKLKNGNRWRRASSLDLQNSIIAGFPTGATFESITNVGSSFINNVVHAYTTVSSASPTFPSTYGIDPFDQSNYASANSFLKLANDGAFFTCSLASSYDPLYLRPNTLSPAYDGADGEFTEDGLSYRGAIAPAATATTIWTAGWTNFNPGFCCK